VDAEVRVGRTALTKIQTDKKRKLIKLLSENVGLAKPKTMLEMMLEAVYSEETARQQSGILSGIREEPDFGDSLIMRMFIELEPVGSGFIPRPRRAREAVLFADRGLKLSKTGR